MKVVFFCGGLGTRLREYTETIPKPMVHIGERPILWHLMAYYAHFGHCEFLLCLGYKGDVIRRYFIEQSQFVSRDVEYSIADNEIHLTHPELEENSSDWKITFVETGSDANVGQRLRAVEPYLNQDETFLANYSDGLSNLPLRDYLDHFHRAGKIASFACVRPNNSFHAVDVGSDGLVQDICPASQSEFWINGGFFAFKQEIFDYLHDGEELVEEPFRRLIAEKQLLAYPHEGFWACMDTPKDKKRFDDMESRGDRPWQFL